jgi:hypothetical protein
MVQVLGCRLLLVFACLGHDLKGFLTQSLTRLDWEKFLASSGIDRRINSLIALLVAGRPIGFRLDSHAQYRAKLGRAMARTGLRMMPTFPSPPKIPYGGFSLSTA